MATILNGLLVFNLEPHILALLGATSMASGTLLVVWGAAKLSARHGAERAQSFLAPTLAVDALDSDLRVIYLQTLVLDARCQDRFGDEHAAAWSPLGRELRRSIVAVQAGRHRGKQRRDAVDVVDDLITDASEYIETKSDLGPPFDALVEAARHARE